MTPIEYYSQCPECRSSIVHDYTKGEYICHMCGYVVIEAADDFGPENHSTDFEEKSKNTRASGSTSFSMHAESRNNPRHCSWEKNAFFYVV